MHSVMCEIKWQNDLFCTEIDKFYEYNTAQDLITSHKVIVSKDSKTHITLGFMWCAKVKSYAPCL